MGLKCTCKRSLKLSDFMGPLKMLSMGKHNQGLFLNGNRLYSSWIGGLVTLFLAFMFLMFTIATLKSIFNKDQYLLSYNLKKID